MAQADFKKTVSVSKDKLLQTIVKYEEYPRFVDGVKAVHVERKGPGKARVKYSLSLMKDFTYTLDMVEDLEGGKVSWTLVDSDLFKKNDGRWEVRATGSNSAEAHYFLDVEFKIYVPGMILRKLVSGNLPSMVEGFEKQAQK